MKTLTAKPLPTKAGWGNPLLLFARHAVQGKLASLSEHCIAIHDPLGRWQSNTEQTPDISIDVTNLRFYVDTMLAGGNGAASAFRKGYWDCHNLTALFQILIRNLAQVDQLESGLAGLGTLWRRHRHRSRGNTIKGSRRNIQAHYDLGNDFFQSFLDPTMTYSCGIFADETATLEQASVAKLDAICRKLALQSSHHVLEIGCGWGSFAIHAARNYGCRVTATTISRQQYEFARQRIGQCGLAGRIDVKLCDYRRLSGRYDKLVSIEMIEAVGHEFLPLYFASCADLLRPNGQMLLQAITMPDRRYDRYLGHSDFIQQFIFPGSCVPSLSAIMNAVNTSTDLRIDHLEDFAPHYARTLRSWLNRFLAARESIGQQGYRQDFIRLWEYYLCYCEAGFRERYTGLLQIRLNKSGYDKAAIT